MTVGVLLLIPLLAMQFTNEVDWKIGDFLIMGFLFIGTVFLCEFIMRKTKSITNRIVFCGVILISLILIWAELAVGLFGTPFAGS